MRFAILSAVLLLLTGCHGPAKSGEEKEPEKEPTTVEFAKAEIRPMDLTVQAQGTLAAAEGGSTRIASVIPGRLLEVRVKEGDTVGAGQVVAVVDGRTQQAAARGAQAAVAAANSTALQAEASARAAAADHDSAVATASVSLEAAMQDKRGGESLAKSALAAAETDLRQTRAGNRPQEIAQADLAVRQAAANRDHAKTELDRVQALFDGGIAAKKQVDQAKTDLTVAESTLESARQQAALMHAGARTEVLRAAEIKVEQAKESLRVAQESGDAKVRLARAALRQAEQGSLQVTAKRDEARAARDTAAQKQADLEAARANLAFVQIHSPIAGTVVRRLSNPGDMADPAAPILEISNVRSLNLLASLAAEQGGQIRSGMLARITPADQPGKVYNGVVVSVGQVDPQTNLEQVRIRVPNPGTLSIGGFANAAIVVRRNSRAVVVPRQAVIEREGKNVVFVAGADDVAHQKEVELGAEEEKFVEITHGIASGDRVITLGQNEVADGGKVKEAEKEKEKPEKEK